MNEPSRIVRTAVFNPENELHRLRSLLQGLDDALTAREGEWENRACHLTLAAIEQTDALLVWQNLAVSADTVVSLEVRMLPRESDQ